MKKWIKIALGTLVVLLIVAAVWWGWASRGPEYKGRGVREYTDAYLFSSAWQWYRVLDGPGALRFFGTNTVPYIRDGLRTRDTWNRRAMMWVARKAPSLRIRVFTATDKHFAALLIYRDTVRNGYWGEASAACESEVRALTNDPEMFVCGLARTLLDAIDASNKTMRVEARTVGEAGVPATKY